MEQAHRIKIKIGNAEFDAEGSPELVKEQFKEFMAAVSLMGPEKSANPTPAANLPALPNPPLVDKTGVDASILERIFMRGDPLSLAALPKTDNANPDALLVLLYGYTKILGSPQVTGTMLMKSAKKSGVNVDRIDRVINAHADFILSAGAKKGMRYSLNNRGIQAAEQIIRATME
jgi:hypothetical protein